LIDPILTPEQLAEVQAYYAPHYAIGKVLPLFDTIISVLMLAYVVRPVWGVASRGAARLEERFGRLRSLPGSRVLFKVLDRLWDGTGWGAALLFAFIWFGIDVAISLPLDVYLEYFHEHAFGLSNYTPGAYAFDTAKGLLLLTLAQGALAFGLFGLVRKLKYWWAVMGAVGALVLIVSAAVDPYRARIMFDQTPLPPGELRDQITGLMKQADVDFKDVLVEKTTRATKRVQAYFAGRGPTRTIVLNDALLQEMKPDEILAAVAHEAGHTKEDKLPGQIASTLALFAFLFVVDRLLRLTHRKGWFGVTEVSDIRALPLILTVFGVIQLFAIPISGYFSREREREADRFALALTHNPEAFQRMLKVACRVNKMDPDPPWWKVLRGQSHPSIRERFESAGGPKQL
jgi:STE24 endopeptidase